MSIICNNMSLATTSLPKKDFVIFNPNFGFGFVNPYWLCFFTEAYLIIVTMFTKWYETVLVIWL